MRRNPPQLVSALLALALLATTTAAASFAADVPVLPPGTAAQAGVVAQAALSAPAPSAELRFPELPNFHRVDDHLFRGGQPGMGGLGRLKALGVHTVLNLRYERALGKAEEAEAKAQGLQYVNIPMYGLLPPTRAQISQALALLEDPRNWPVFVHCQRGSDRTGAVVACYRILHSGWTAKQAIREAMGYGMMHLEILKRRFVRDFYAQTAQHAGALATLATGTSGAD